MACVSMTRLRFGIVSEPVREARQWLDFARRADDSGIDMLPARCQGQKVMPTTKGTHNNHSAQVRSIVLAMADYG